MIAGVAIVAILAIALTIILLAHKQIESANERYIEMMKDMQRHAAQQWRAQHAVIDKMAERVQSPDARISAALYGEYATLKEEKVADDIDAEWLDDPASEMEMTDDDFNAFSDLLPVESE